MTRFARASAGRLRLLLTDRGTQKLAIRWMLRSIAFSGALLTLVLPFFGEPLLWRLAVAVTLCAIVIERAVFEWFPTFQFRLWRPPTDGPLIIHLFEEPPNEPVDVDRTRPDHTPEGRGKGRRYARIRQVDPEKMAEIRARWDARWNTGQATGTDADTGRPAEQDTNGDQT